MDVILNLSKTTSIRPENITYTELSKDTYWIQKGKNHPDLKVRMKNDRNNRHTLLLNEALGLIILKERGDGFPHPKLLSTLKDAAENSFSIQTFIPGLILTNVRSKKKRFSQYTKLGSFLKRLHSIRGSVCGRLVMPSKKSWQENFLDHFQADFNIARDQITYTACKVIKNKISNNLELIPDSVSLLHGDLHPANIIVHDNEIALIDYHHCLFGDPIFDVAQFYVRVFRYEDDVKGALDALLNGLDSDYKNYTLIETYATALLVNEIAFSITINKPDRASFYTEKLYLLNRKGI